MYQDDALLQRTRSIARNVVLAVNASPNPRKREVMKEALDSIGPGLFQKVEDLLNRSEKQGISAAAALEDVLARALADELVKNVRALGRAKLTGRVDDAAMAAQAFFYPDPPPLSGLENAGKDIANFAKNLMQAAACSPNVRDAVVSRTTDQTGRDVANIGFDLAKGVAQCQPSAAPPAQSPAQSPALPPSPPAETSGDRTTKYVLAGVAVLVAGAVAFVALRKPKS